MRGQCSRSVRAKKRGDHAHSRPIRCHGVPTIFLTAPLSYDAVALHRGPCEKLRRYRKLAISFLPGNHQMSAPSISACSPPGWHGICCTRKVKAKPIRGNDTFLRTKTDRALTLL